MSDHAKTRVVQLPIRGWAAQVRQGCCLWINLHKADGTPFIPTMSYEDYHVCASEEEAKAVEQKYLSRQRTQ